ncbi:MAG: sn-glycerol-3-phosphate ABC transporter ATP-binding protein UgpC [Melioribacteraceae bacterium]|nr:sn-glycerol-3-phosphate ABC transporter ATP-binding protein UgpC [Melioribacteraceae bacterium]
MADVVLKNICKSYDGKINAVDNVNLEVKDKEFVVLVGPSGCGKSTTLRMIAGLEEITKGELYIGGNIVNNVPPKDRDIAMVFQNYALYPHMTVYDNMAFGLKLRKFKKTEIAERVNYAANILGIEELLSRKPKALSGGQRQRVALGRTIVRKPKVFLFDEPLSNLDAKLRVQMRTEISKLHNKLQTTMIYVTHDQTEAMTMGDRIVIMKDGLVNQVDTPINLYNNPTNKFVAGFIGSPAMNFIHGKIVWNNELSFKTNNYPELFKFPNSVNRDLKALENKDVIIGIRPEDISLEPKSEKSVKMTITIDVIEQMGNEIFFYFIVEGIQFTARIPSTHLPVEGEKTDIYLESGKLKYFDTITNDVINN